MVGICAEKLREFVEDQDQNLKYLGLCGLASLMLSFPRAVAEFRFFFFFLILYLTSFFFFNVLTCHYAFERPIVIGCLLDDDITIRLQALELVTGMGRFFFGRVVQNFFLPFYLALLFNHPFSPILLHFWAEVKFFLFDFIAVTKRNLPDIVAHLIEHLTNVEMSYRDTLTGKIIFICR